MRVNKSLTPDTSSQEKVKKRFAVILPFLSDILLDLEDFDSADVGFKFIEEIKKCHVQEKNPSQDNSQEDAEKPSDTKNTEEDSETDKDGIETEELQGNTKPETQSNLEEAEKDLELIETLEDTYHNILVFLWSVSQGLRSHPGLPLPFCFKKNTMKWVHSMHSQHIVNPVNNLPPFPPEAPPQAVPASLNIPNVTTIQPSNDMKDLTSEFKSLIRAINNNVLSTLTEKQEKKNEKSRTKFNEMSIIKNNTIVMFQVGPHHEQVDVDVMEPPENMIIASNQSTPADVLSLLYHNGARKGIMATYQSGFGATIRDGNITSTPCATDVNGLTIFFIHPGAKAQCLSARETLLYQLKAELGQLDHADVEALTKMELFVPFDFPSFLHMLRGIEFVCEFLGGSQCFSTLAWNHAREHA